MAEEFPDDQITLLDVNTLLPDKHLSVNTTGQVLVKDKRSPLSHPLGRNGRHRILFQEDRCAAQRSEARRLPPLHAADHPDKPRIIPDGTHSLQRAFRAAFEPFEAALRPFVIPVIHEQFEGESKTFYRTVLESIFQTKISEMTPKGEEGKQAWKKLEDFYDTFAAWYVEEGSGPYIMGASPCFADLILMSRIWWIMRVFGSDSPQWQDTRSWSGGKWERMLLQFQHDYD